MKLSKIDMAAVNAGKVTLEEAMEIAKAREANALAIDQTSERDGLAVKFFPGMRGRRPQQKRQATVGGPKGRKERKGLLKVPA